MPHSTIKPKVLVNDLHGAIVEGNEGFAMCNPRVVKIADYCILLRRDYRQLEGKVKLLGGGGGGHHPCFSGFVGPGMLTASIHGELFRPPTSDSILVALREIGAGHPEGVLLIISNFVGDRINFGLALERAQKEKIKVRILVVGDDCAVAAPTEATGRRGLAGVAFVVKVAGAMADEGRKLEDIYNACREPCFTEMSTLGVALRAPHVPGATSSYHLPDDEIAFGVGIDGNEPGVQSMPIGCTSNEIVRKMLDHMAATTTTLAVDKDVAVLINNLGGTSKLEARVFAMDTMKQLAERKVRVRRVYVGRFMTALNMSAMSITLLGLNASIDIAKYLDAEVIVSGWPVTLTAAAVGIVTDNEFELPVTYAGRQFPEVEALSAFDQGPRLANRGAEGLHQIIRGAAEAIMVSSDQVSALESGESDCRMSVRKGAEEILHALTTHDLNTARPYATLQQLCALCERSMTGTSGILYCIMFTAAAVPFRTMPEDAVVDGKAWLDCLVAGVEALMRHGLARRGDRTMLDPLIAAATAGWLTIDRGDSDPRNMCEAMAKAAEKAAASTVGMPAISGRTSFVFKQVPDPGAVTVSLWMRAISEGVKTAI